MNLSVLERRLHRRVPDAFEDRISEEIARFEVETEAMSDGDEAIGQARLYPHEIERLPMGNQHTEWNVIRWQCVKAAAIHYGVADWIARVDTSLTYEENIELMESLATQNGGQTLREMSHERA